MAARGASTTIVLKTASPVAAWSAARRPTWWTMLVLKAPLAIDLSLLCDGDQGYIGTAHARSSRLSPGTRPA
jgi:hypothetical protein